MEWGDFGGENGDRPPGGEDLLEFLDLLEMLE